MELEAFLAKIKNIQHILSGEILVDDAILNIIEITPEDFNSVEYCAPHSHTWYEANFVFRGTMTTFLYEEGFQISEGEFILVSPGVMHSHYYVKDNTHRGICVRWQLKPNSQYSTNYNSKPSIFKLLDNLKSWKLGKVKDTLGIYSLFLRLVDEMNYGFSILNMQLILVKIISIMAELNHPSKYCINESSEYNHSLVRKVEIYLNDISCNEFNVNSLAATLHMSYGHLSRKYRQITGKTIVNRLIEIRLEKAAFLLRNSEYSVKEIAYKVGFSSQYYFSKVFKETYFVSPSQYKNQQYKNQSV